MKCNSVCLRHQQQGQSKRIEENRVACYIGTYERVSVSSAGLLVSAGNRVHADALATLGRYEVRVDAGAGEPSRPLRTKGRLSVRKRVQRIIYSNPLLTAATVGGATPVFTTAFRPLGRVALYLTRNRT